MNTDMNRLDPAFDPRIADWLEADPDRAPAEVVDTILAALPSVPQRRATLVPWRLPDMLTPYRAAMAAVLGVLVIGGALLLVQRPGQSNVGGPGPTPSTISSPSPSPMPFEAFGAARDRICHDAAATLDPIQARFGSTYDASVSDAARLAWVADLEAFADGYDRMIGALNALPPPAALAVDHAADLADFREEERLIRQAAAALRAGDWVLAKQADLATDPFDRRIGNREAQHAFIRCP